VIKLRNALGANRHPVLAGTMSSIKRLATQPWVQKSIGVLAAEYLRLVRNTSSFRIDPPDSYERLVGELPAIMTFWHGEHFMLPFLRREHRVKALISRHRDGEINAIAAQRLGFETIRASGSPNGDFRRKGGVSGFQSMREALAQGWSVALTADVPKVSRVAGRGVVLLGQASGRPIYPVAAATSRYFKLNNWDRSTVNLPFSHFAITIGDPIRVPAAADDRVIEDSRRQVEAELNRVTERAYAAVKGRGGLARRID
jgi:lysophospholipid acyltransferase (LPLAT)-like uncharacterized protein